VSNRLPSVKLAEASTGQPVLTVFVRGDSAVKTKAPPGMYVVKYASGDAWYGYERLFGPHTTYSQARENFLFDHVSGYTITLYPVLNGNLRTDRIDAKKF